MPVSSRDLLVIAGAAAIGLAAGFAAIRSGGDSLAPEPPAREPAIERPSPRPMVRRDVPAAWNRVLRRRDERIASLRSERGVWYRAPAWLAANEAGGATTHDRSQVFDGVNLVLSGHASEAALCDLDGKILHTWRIDFAAVWPEPLAFEEAPAHRTFWRRAAVLPNGDLLAIFDGIGMIRLDRESNLIWRSQERCHGDLCIAADGKAYTMSRRVRMVQEKPPVSILDDVVVVLSADGTVERAVSLLEAFRDSDHQNVIRQTKDQNDVFGTSSIALLDGRLGERIPAFRAGCVLLSLTNVDTLAVLDLDRAVVTWTMAGPWARQQSASVVDRDLLVFDGEGDGRGAAVIEIDPVTRELGWSYAGAEQRPLATDLGSGRRLPNGNTLVVATAIGCAFEVTKAGDVVWEFVNPHREGAGPGSIAALYDVVRIAWDQLSMPEAEGWREGR